MYGLSLLVAAIGMVAAAPSVEVDTRQVAQVASVDRYAGGGCTGTICVSQRGARHNCVLIVTRTLLAPATCTLAVTRLQMPARRA
jgi:hypothetical protein